LAYQQQSDMGVWTNSHPHTEEHGTVNDEFEARVKKINKTADESHSVPVQLQDFYSLTGDNINFQLLQETCSTEGRLFEINTLAGAEPMNVSQGGRFDNRDIVYTNVTRKIS
jgi:hypothetical protein